MDMENAINLGKHWAAIRGDQAIAVIPMTIPQDVDFEEYRRRAISTLELLGEVKTGDVLDDYGQRCFVKRNTHENRGRNPRPPKVFPIFQPPTIIHSGGKT